MQKLIFYASSLALGLMLASPAQSAVTTEMENRQTESFLSPVLAQYETTEYELYYNNSFNFQVQYPTDLLRPLSPPNNVDDGRVFVSPTRDIRMVTYGRPQVDQSLETYYQSHLQSYDLRGAEVTFASLGDNEFIIAGYDPIGNVFYRKTLLRDENFLVLGVTYEPELQPEFDPIVAEIADSFQVSRDRATKQRQPYEPPSDYRQIQIYFPEADTEIFTEVAPVTRTTDRVDVVEYAIEQLLIGPSEAEQDRVNALPIQPVGESNCGERTFTVDLIEGTAIVQFCRDIIVGDVGDGSSFERALLSTLTQFAIVTQVVVLNADGQCLFDASGSNDCFLQLPDRYTIGT